MTYESLREHCLRKPGTEVGFPFGEGTAVFTVMGKMFALTDVDGFPFSANLKCEPERAVELRDRYASVTPGYHMNKKHWNTVIDDGEVPEREILSMIDHSYDQVVAKLTRKDRTALGEMEQTDARGQAGTGLP